MTNGIHVKTWLPFICSVINKQKALVEQSERIKKRQVSANNAELQYLNAEKQAIKAEKNREKEQLNALKEDKQEKLRQGESTDSTDTQIAASEAKIATLNEKKQANQRAKVEANRNSRNLTPNAIAPCPLHCEASKLTVKCSHDGREAQPSSDDAIQALHVISASSKSNKSKVDTVSIFLDGGCGQGKTTVSRSKAIPAFVQRNEEGEHCPYVIVKGGSPATDVRLPGTAGSPLLINAYSPVIEQSHLKPNWYVFFRHIFMLSEAESIHKYTVESMGCGGPYDALIAEVYAHTKIKWEGAYAMGWKKPDASSGKLAPARWDVDAKMAGMIDTTSFDIGMSLQDDLFPNIKATIEGVSRFFGRIDEVTGSKDKAITGAKDNTSGNDDIVKFSINYPKIAFAGSYENKENPKSHQVDTEYKMALKLDPLIGAKIDVDILQALLSLAANGIAPGSAAAGKKFISFVEAVLKKIDKKKRRDQTDAEKAEAKKTANSVNYNAAIMLTVEGNIGAELSWTKTLEGKAMAQTQSLSPSPAAEGKGMVAGGAAAAIKFELKGDICGDVKHSNRYFVINAGMGVGFSVGAATGGSPSEIAFKLVSDVIDDKPAIAGCIEYNGLGLYYMKYATASLKASEDSEKDLTNRPSGGSKKFKQKSKSLSGEEVSNPTVKETQNTEVWTIIEPSRIPKEGNKPFYVAEGAVNHD